MNFYIMINYRKIRSNNKSKVNFLKIWLKEVGTLTPKKYSSIIVNDIKLDFSIILKKKSLKINIIKNNELNKSTEIKRKNNNIFTYRKPKPIDNNYKIYTKKKVDKIRASKTPITK